VREPSTKEKFKYLQELSSVGRRAFWDPEDRCKEQCQAELKACEILQTMRASGKGRGWFHGSSIT